ncbi:hypothetical protein ILUMI_12577 [Ignelater luminosus]|uniref:Uncharacterized protein n=1 Tax=Ignelater luminosus TaxID=2038154 RepID=A0A8K0G6M8_IGNLU|nr:hypothetical protein ILUMI_12577 [Ignelater luminosus]
MAERCEAVRNDYSKVKSKQKISNLLNDKRSTSENNVASNNHQELLAPKEHVLLTEQDVLEYNTQLESGISNIQPVTTKTGKLRQRMKWTNEINRTVMYCYYKATNGEKELLGYRSKMYNLFVNIHPQMKNVTEERIADQRRMIVVNNKIPQTILDELKDKVINTKNYKKYILQDKTLTDDKCRVCNQQQETIEHIIAGCSILASTDYIRRHDYVAKIVHQHLALHHNLIESKVPHYKYSPKILLENSNTKLYWNQSVITDRTINYNKPDIIFMNKEHKRTYLVEIADPLTNHLQRKHTEKIQKYIELAAEIKDMWEQREVKIIPVILSTTAVIPHTLHRAIQQLQMPEMIFKEMQKAVILDVNNNIYLELISLVEYLYLNHMQLIGSEEILILRLSTITII